MQALITLTTRSIVLETHRRILRHLRRFVRAGIDENRHVELVGQQHKLRILTIVQLEAEVVGRQRLGDRFLAPSPVRSSGCEGPRPLLPSECVSSRLPPSHACDDFGVAVGDHELEFLLFLFLLFGLLAFTGAAHPAKTPSINAESSVRLLKVSWRELTPRWSPLWAWHQSRT